MSEDFVMPWGKYAGQSIEEVPDDYLAWILGSVEDEKVLIPAEREYDYRKKHGVVVDD